MKKYFIAVAFLVLIALAPVSAKAATIDQLVLQIQQLLQIVQQLQAQILAMNGGTTTQPSITVLSPNGGEQLMFGGKDIDFRTKWTYSNLTGNVAAYLNLLDGRTCLLGQVPVSSGEFSMKIGNSYQCPNIPYDITAGQYKVLLAADNGNQYADAAATDKSNDYFTVSLYGSSQPSITISSVNPSQGAGDNAVTITGANLNVSGGMVQFFKNGQQVSFQYTSPSVNGTQVQFNLDRGLAPGSYQIRVANPNGVSNFLNFTILSSQPAPNIISVNPNSGGNGSYIINGSNLTSTNQIMVEFYRNGQMMAGVPATVVNVSQLQFVIQGAFMGNVDPGQYQILVRTSNGKSNSLNFTVGSTAQPSITVVYPNGGEVINNGNNGGASMLNIRWNTSIPSDIYRDVDIDLLDSSGTYIKSIANAVHDGVYVWMSDPSLANGTYKLRIEFSKGASSPAYSGLFTVTSTRPNQPSITVTSPNGGETLVQGQTYTITWNSAGLPSTDRTVSIALQSIPSHYSYGIAMLLPADAHSYSWTVPSTVPIGTQFQIEISDLANRTADDLSNNYFTIVAPTPAVPTITSLSPSSGPIGTQVKITGSGFNSNNQVFFGNYPVAIGASDGGTSLTFTVPPYFSSPTDTTPNVFPGMSYSVVVRNINGSSPAAYFIVTAPAASTVPPTIDLKINNKDSDTVTSGDKFMLSWAVSPSTATCNSSWVSVPPALTGSATIDSATLPQSSTSQTSQIFSLSCVNASSASVSKSVIVNINPRPAQTAASAVSACRLEKLDSTAISTGSYSQLADCLSMCDASGISNAPARCLFNGTQVQTYAAAPISLPAPTMFSPLRSGPTSQVVLQWRTNTTATVGGASVERSANSTDWQELTKTTGTYYVDTNSSASSNFSYRVKTFSGTTANPGTYSSYSNVVSVSAPGSSSVTPTAPAPAPTSVLPMPTMTSASRNTFGAVVINWTNNSNKVYGISIERSTDKTNWTEITKIAGAVQLYIDSNSFSGANYYYRIRTFDGTTYAPGHYSPYSAVVDSNGVISANTSTKSDQLASVLQAVQFLLSQIKAGLR